MNNALLSPPELNASARSERPAASARWTQVLSHLDPKFGGISAAVPELGSQLVCAQHLNIDIAAFCGPDDDSRLDRYPELTLTRWPASRGAWLRSGQLHSQLRDTLRSADGVHIHGLWEASTSMAAQAARKLGLPYIISAHGMLEPWALKNKKLKKRIYSALIERSNIEGANCLHALTQAEADDYRRFGSKRPIAIIPNGVNAPPVIKSDAFMNQFPQLVGRRIILFLGRIHFKKGLDILVESWAALVTQFPDDVLVLAGPDSENSQAAVEKLAAELGLADRILFAGMLNHELKWSALSAAHCFVLPSYSEGLSVAVLEAMSMGVPVIVTEHCHLPEVALHGAGWEIRANKDELERCLRTALQMSPLEREITGSKGLRLVQQRFSWPVVAAQMADLYTWVAGGVRPGSFEILGVAS